MTCVNDERNYTAGEMLQIGDTVAIDPLSISAMYVKHGNTLVIRFNGIGIIELQRCDLFKSIKATFDKLLEYNKEIP